MSRVLDRYKKQVVAEMMNEFKYSTPMQVPVLEKIVVNCGVGEMTQNGKAMEYVIYAITQITGQKPKIAKSRKAIAAFKLRAGLAIGCSVTMRRKRMYDFFDRLVAVALPRVRDFKGVPRTGFDGRGSYTMGLKEQIVFPEVNIDKLDKVRGMDITFVTTANTDEEARALLEKLGMPFRKQDTVVAQAAGAR